MRPSRQVSLLCLLVLLGVVASACVAAADPVLGDGPKDEEPTAEIAEVARTTIVPTMRPTSAESLGIALDRSGRPYDNYLGSEGATADIRSGGSLFVDRGRLEIVGGQVVLSPGPVTIRQTRSVDFRGVDELDLRFIWKQEPSAPSERDGDGSEDSDSDSAGGSASADDGVPSENAPTILGVIVAVPDTKVARWGDFTEAYESNNGLGALTSRSVLEWSGRNVDAETAMVNADILDRRPFALDDVDGDELKDLLIFENSSEVRGSQSYSLTKGFNDEDILVSILIWHGGFPWRLAVTDGTPPPDVTDREEELIDCIEGRRLIDKWGRCT